MLEEIYIENLAVIEKATVQFTNDLNVFTSIPAPCGRCV